MGDINLFRIQGAVTELFPSIFKIERELQTLVEKNMQAFFGVTFLQSEFQIDEGRIDSLGIDENYCPVIFEYKRNQNDNVINQGLFYLNWLMKHKADFKLLTIEKLGMETANKIDWSLPCVICIASDFNKYDEHAVIEMRRNIKLIRYKKFEDFLLFEQLNTPITEPIKDPDDTKTMTKRTTDKTFTEQISDATPEIKEIYYNIKNYIHSLGDDISENQLKQYVAYKKIKNFICVQVLQNSIRLFLNLNPDTLIEEQNNGIVRNVRNIGHWGTGDTEITIKTQKDFETTKYLINKCYNEN